MRAGDVTRELVSALAGESGLELTDREADRVRAEVQDRLAALPSPLRWPVAVAVRAVVVAGPSRWSTLEAVPGAGDACRLLRSLTVAAALDGRGAGAA